MAEKWQRFAIILPEEYSATEREAIAQEVLDFITTRTQDDNLDKRNRKFAPYSKDYIASLDFKIAGKSKGDINLTLSGDMIAAMQLLTNDPGKIVLGYEKGSSENAKADGNIRGTYGHSKPVAKGRDFLGIHPDDLALILARYPLDDRAQSLTQAEKITGSKAAAGEVVAGAGQDLEDEEG